jgi:hypothetical protein
MQKKPMPARAFSASAANFLSSSDIHFSSCGSLDVPEAPSRLYILSKLDLRSFSAASGRGSPCPVTRMSAVFEGRLA